MAEDIAIMIVFVTGILTAGGVILLRPLARRLGDLLEVLIQEKRGALAASKERPARSPELERIEERLGSLEERFDFAEALLASPRRVLPEAAREPVALGAPPAEE